MQRIDFTPRNPTRLSSQYTSCRSDNTATATATATATQSLMGSRIIHPDVNVIKFSNTQIRMNASTPLQTHSVRVKKVFLNVATAGRDFDCAALRLIACCLLPAAVPHCCWHAREVVAQRKLN